MDGQSGVVAGSRGGRGGGGEGYTPAVSGLAVPACQAAASECATSARVVSKLKLLAVYEI